MTRTEIYNMKYPEGNTDHQTPMRIMRSQPKVKDAFRSRCSAALLNSLAERLERANAPNVALILLLCDPGF